MKKKKLCGNSRMKNRVWTRPSSPRKIIDNPQSNFFKNLSKKTKHQFIQKMDTKKIHFDLKQMNSKKSANTDTDSGMGKFTPKHSRYSFMRNSDKKTTSDSKKEILKR